jgi:excisionase family DNA binding protein
MSSKLEVDPDPGRSSREMIEPLLLTADRMAALLEISKRTLWRLRSAGRLPRPVLLGGSVRWRSDEVRLWVSRGCPTLREWERFRPNGEGC